MSAPTTIARLRCEYLVDPLGIDETRPRLGWTMDSDRRGARQTAWQVRVASSRERLEAGSADLWDSGRVEDRRSTHIVYEGVALESRMTCHWQVTVWDEEGRATRSEPGLWTMGLSRREDWRARWISHDPEIIRRDPAVSPGSATEPGASPLFRKGFTLPAPARRAVLYATARGLIDLQLNGRRVSEDRFMPEWTSYDKRLHYRTFDVTGLVVPGENVLGAWLGDGWWSGFVGWQETRGRHGSLRNSLLIQLEVELRDGETVVVVTDDSWRCETGPILSSDFMMGETYDARRERSGWDRPGFDDSSWLGAEEVAPSLVHTPRFFYSNNQSGDGALELPLVAQPSEPVRVTETLRPVSVNAIAPGVWIYDLGQNIAGWVRLAVTEPAGTRIELRHAERLNPDGTLYTDNLRRAKATDVYTTKGGAEEVWEPRFTFHGFQYVEISGPSQAPSLDAVAGRVVMSATRPAGEFGCSHPLVERLWRNALWGQKGNFLSVPTDCPQRDERLGWMGDAQVFLRTATYNMDVAAFFTKWMTDIVDSQDVDGVFPDVAPRLREGDDWAGLDGLGGAAGWADAGIIVPWTMLRVYGDVRIVERHWSAMVRWLDWLERTNPDAIRRHALHNNYGDWLCIPSDREFRTHSEMKTLLATAYWADDAAKMAHMARVLGREKEAERFTAMHERVRDAFCEEWLREDGSLSVETQTAYLLALAFDLVPTELRQQAASHLVANIEALGGHLSTGFIGISHLNPILTLFGHADVAYRLLLNEDYPSWLYPVIHGATTIWERWNGWTEKDGFFDPTMNSFNHYSLGSVSEWLYRHVAGIELDATVPGFEQFVVRPFVGGGLAHAGASYDSIHGRIESRWRVDDGRFSLTVRVPANARARVFVPCDPSDEVTEGDRPAAESPGVQPVGRDGGHAVFCLESGTYELACKRTR